MTGSEIGAYVQRRVTSYTSSQQTPDFGTLELDDRGELVIPLSIDALPRRQIPAPPIDTSPVDRRGRPNREPATSAKPRTRKAAPRRSKAKDVVEPAQPIARRASAEAVQSSKPPPGDRTLPAPSAAVSPIAPGAEPPPGSRQEAPLPASGSGPSRRTTARMFTPASKHEPPALPPGDVQLLDVQPRKNAGSSLLARIGRFLVRCIVALLAAVIAMLLLTAAISLYAAAGPLVILASLAITGAIFAGRRAGTAPSFLRSFSAKLLKRKLLLCLTGLTVFMSLISGIGLRRLGLEACDTSMKSAEALRQSDRDGASTALLSAAKTCDKVDRNDDAEQMRREAAVAASSEAARSSAGNRAASFAAAVAEAQRQPDTVAGVASAVEAYRRALQLGTLNKAQSALFAIRLYAQGEAMAVKGNYGGAIAAFEEVKTWDPDIEVDGVLAAARTAQRRRATATSAKKAASATPDAEASRKPPEPTGSGNELQRVDAVYPDAGQAHSDGGVASEHSPP